MKLRYRLIMSLFGIVSFFIGYAFAQQPAPNKPAPQQLDVEFQNQILKLQVNEKDVQDGYAQCVQKAQAEFDGDQKQIDAATKAGLKKLGLDPGKYEVNLRTFYVFPKPDAGK